MTPQPTLPELVLAHVRSPNYRPVKPKVLAKQLNLPPDQHRELRKAVKKLVRSGQLAFGDKHVLPIVLDLMKRILTRGDRFSAVSNRQRLMVAGQLSMLGRNSLNVFCVASLLSLLGQIIRFVYSGSFVTDTVVVTVGLLVMWTTAWLTDWNGKA